MGPLLDHWGSIVNGIFDRLLFNNYLPVIISQSNFCFPKRILFWKVIEGVPTGVMADRVKIHKELKVKT